MRPVPWSRAARVLLPPPPPPPPGQRHSHVPPRRCPLRAPAREEGRGRGRLGPGASSARAPAPGECERASERADPGRASEPPQGREVGGPGGRAGDAEPGAR